MPWAKSEFAWNQYLQKTDFCKPFLEVAERVKSGMSRNKSWNFRTTSFKCAGHTKKETGQSRIWVINRGFTAEKPDYDFFLGLTPGSADPDPLLGTKSCQKVFKRLLSPPGRSNTAWGVITPKLVLFWANCRQYDNSDFLNEEMKSSLRKWNHGRHALRRVSTKMINIDPWEFWLYPKCGYFK